MSPQPVYAAIARSLREFGYSDVTPDMVRETHEALIAGDSLPHGVIGMFAKGSLQDAADAKLIPTWENA